MKKEQVEKSVKSYLDLVAQKKEIMAKMDGIQGDINNYCDANLSEFSLHQIALESGTIKLTQNPPKLVHHESRKNVTTSERDKLVLDLPMEYVDMKLNLRKITVRINGDKNIKNIIKAKGYEIVQDSRYAIKGY